MSLRTINAPRARGRRSGMFKNQRPTQTDDIFTLGLEGPRQLRQRLEADLESQIRARATRQFQVEIPQLDHIVNTSMPHFLIWQCRKLSFRHGVPRIERSVIQGLTCAIVEQMTSKTFSTGILRLCPMHWSYSERWLKEKRQWKLKFRIA